MARTPIALTAGLAAITTVAVIATTGSAQGPAPTTLHLVGKTQKAVGFGTTGPHHKPRQGDRFGFGDTVTGDDTGIARGVCTLIGKNALCTVVVQLSKGTLTVQFLSSEQHANKTPVAVTGGTGAYDGARGTALVTDVNKTTTDLQVTLRP
jgi:hypothetical protein